MCEIKYHYLSDLISLSQRHKISSQKEENVSFVFLVVRRERFQNIHGRFVHLAKFFPVFFRHRPFQKDLHVTGKRLELGQPVVLRDRLSARGRERIMKNVVDETFAKTEFVQSFLLADPLQQRGQQQSHLLYRHFVSQVRVTLDDLVLKTAGRLIGDVTVVLLRFHSQLADASVSVVFAPHLERAPAVLASVRILLAVHAFHVFLPVR